MIYWWFSEGCGWNWKALWHSEWIGWNRREEWRVMVDERRSNKPGLDKTLNGCDVCGAGLRCSTLSIMALQGRWKEGEGGRGKTYRMKDRKSSWTSNLFLPLPSYLSYCPAILTHKAASPEHMDCLVQTRVEDVIKWSTLCSYKTSSLGSVMREMLFIR